MFSNCEKPFDDFVYTNISCVRAGISTFMSISDERGPSIFLSKDGKNVAYEGRNGCEGVYFPPESAFFLYSYYKRSAFPYLYLNLACKQLYFQARKNYKQEKREYEYFRSLISLRLPVYCTDCD